MFTGLVEQVGTVAELVRLADEAAQLKVAGELVVVDAQAGDSIAVNGVCLTVVDWDSSGFTVDVMRETLDRSNLGTLTVGSPVNLERALTVGDRIGGHLVSGHVDAVAQLASREASENWEVFQFSLPEALAPLVSEKGSITVNGVSLTVVGVSEIGAATPWFSVSLIPTTIIKTNLGLLTVGESVNLEVDVLARYVARLNEAQPVTEEQQ